MQHIRPYHFARVQVAGFRPYYRAIVQAGGVVCFDLEDSVRVADDEEATLALKRNQRHRLRQLLRACRPNVDRLAVRINAPATLHYAADLASLRGWPGLHAVFVPKAEHPDTLRQVLRELPAPVRHVIPVVETAAAVAGLPELLAPADPRLGLVAFGHCDYNLSLNHFPFHHHDSPQYWEWIAELDAHLQAAGKRLLNSPVLRLADAAHFRQVLHQLRSYPSAAGQITLCLAQTRACATPTPSSLVVGPRPAAAADTQELTQQFEQHQQPGSFFALDANRRLISPHEYEAARQLPSPWLPCT